MAISPKACRKPSLAVCLLIATLAWAAAPIKAARAAQTAPIAVAWPLYYGGKSLQARRVLEDFLSGPEGQDQGDRLIVLENLLDICIRSLADDCVLKYAPVYADVAGKRPVANDVQRVERARRAGYYLFTAQLAGASRDRLAAILASDNWKYENAYDAELYLRRQVLAADLHLRLGQLAEANRSVDKILSLIASLDQPSAARPTIIWALSDVMETLVVIGDLDRAYGLFRAAVGGVGQTLPPLSVDAAHFALRAGLLLDEMGQPEQAQRFLDVAIATIDQIELEPSVRRHLLVLALTAKANACNALAPDCARLALERHPFRELYETGARTPQSVAEVQYLAARAMAAALAGAPDPVVAAALQRPLTFSTDPAEIETLKAYQSIGWALAGPSVTARGAALQEAGRRIRDVARRKRDAPFGAWYRSGSLDQSFIRLALVAAEADRSADGADVVFTLLQLANRRGRSFDADALTVLGQARDPLQRRAIHQALRLRARRDALEREKIQAVAQQLTSAPTGSRLRADYGARMQLRDYAVRIGEASAGLAKDGISISGTNLVTLKQLQSVLAPNEAALTLAPSIGGDLVYMCVRRDTTQRRVVRADLNRVDFKLMQVALTAGHAPSETADAQFPAASAVRLYDVLIRPFAPCLKPGDHILWLPNLSLTGFPLAALLEQAPPKMGPGYDLSQAAWLARSHAVTYAGSAAVLVASRAGPKAPPSQFDFLGVGDPEFSGTSSTGEDRAKVVLRGVRAGSRLAALAALPETGDELRRSAQGFRAPRLLLKGEATEGGLRREMTGAYRYLSFATHGLLREDLQGLAEPALALTPVSGAEAMDDGLLTAPEIADLNLTARFVALSACNTANFDLGQMAQDLPALASAFAVAGVPATLGTLWPVESETGKQVVAGAFERLQAGQGAGEALVEAQRAFLAAPPSRAYLHPRFWAPFVILGDGGRPPAAPPASLKVKAVDVTPGVVGEVLQVRRSEGGGVLAQVGGSAASGPGVVIALGPEGEVWRRASRDAFAVRFLVELGPALLVGGNAQGPSGRPGPVIEALDRASGAPLADWRGEAGAAPGALLVGGAKLDARRAVFAVTTLIPPDQVGKAHPRLSVYVVDGAATPRLLFEVETPGALPIAAATFTPVGEALLVTYSARAVFPYPEPRFFRDDYDRPPCGQEALTRVELRDVASGALKGEAELRGHLINAAIEGPGGEILLGGSVQGTCAGQARATVVAVDKALKTRPLYRDESLGVSDVRTLAALPDGRVFAAASKDNTVEFRPARKGPVAVSEADVAQGLFGGMLFMIGRDGRASAPVLIDAGTSLFVTSSEAGVAGDILLGGAVGDRPAIFHLAADAGLR